MNTTDDKRPAPDQESVITLNKESEKSELKNFFSSARSSVADVSIAFTVIGLSASTRNDKPRGSVVMAKTHSRVAGYNGYNLIWPPAICAYVTLSKGL